MRMRLQKEQGTIAPLKAGEGGYYDLDFILMYLRLKAAGMFFPSLNTPQRIEIVEQTGHLDRSDAESLLRAATFFRALDHAIRLVNGRAEEKLPAAAEERTLVTRLLNLWISPAVEENALERTVSDLRIRVRNSFEAVFGTA